MIHMYILSHHVHQNKMFYLFITISLYYLSRPQTTYVCVHHECVFQCMYAIYCVHTQCHLKLRESFVDTHVL